MYTFMHELSLSFGKYFQIRSQMDGRVLTRDQSTNTVVMMPLNSDDDNQLWYTDVIRFRNSIEIQSKNNNYCLKSLGKSFW